MSKKKEELTRSQEYWRRLSPEQKKRFYENRATRKALKKTGVEIKPHQALKAINMDEGTTPIQGDGKDYTKEWWQELKRPGCGYMIKLTELWDYAKPGKVNDGPGNYEGEPLFIMFVGSRADAEDIFMELKKPTSFVRHLLPPSDNLYKLSLYELFKNTYNDVTYTWDDEEFYAILFKMK